jgi:glutaredoxin 3
MAKIEIYTTSLCPFCYAAKALLSKKGYEFTEIFVADAETRTQMIERANGRRTVPQIFIGGVHVGGYNDLAALDRHGELDPLVQT